MSLQIHQTDIYHALPIMDSLLKTLSRDAEQNEVESAVEAILDTDVQLFAEILLTYNERLRKKTTPQQARELIKLQILRIFISAGNKTIKLQ